MTAPERPVLRWHGGKWLLAPWIIAHFPPHKVYVEPYGGAGSVLLQKPRAYAEVYNDLDQGVVNLFRVLRDDSLSARLVAQLTLTPFARADFEESYAPSSEPVEKARRLVARSFMGFGSDGCTVSNGRTGFRACSNRSGTTPAHDWANYPASLAATIERLRGVVIENRPALDVMAQHDSAETLHYVDPPYLPETRSKKSRYRKGTGTHHAYNHELTESDHIELLGALKKLEGMVVLSGYPSALYDETLGREWRRIVKRAHADGARDRVEALWLNPAALDRLIVDMFSGGVAAA